MPLPLTVSCSSKIQIGFTFLVPAYPGYVILEKRPLNGCCCCCIVSFADGTQTKNDADKKMVSDVEEVRGKLQKL